MKAVTSRLVIIPLVLAAASACGRQNSPATPSLKGTSSAARVAGGNTEAYEHEFENLMVTLRNFYGPLELKRETIAFNFAAAQERALLEIRAMQSTSDFYRLIAKFLNELDDAHVSIQLPTNLRYTLPLQFSAINDRIVLNYVDRVKLPVEACAAHVGDTLVRINGKTPAEYQAGDAAFNKFGNPRTNFAMFARMISGLSEATGLAPEYFSRDSATLEFGTGASATRCEIAYEKSGVGLIGREIEDLNSPRRSILARVNATSAVTEDDGIPDFLKDERLTRLNGILKRWEKLVDTQVHLTSTELPEEESPATSEGQLMEIGAKKPFFALPADFKKIQPGLLGRPIMALANQFTAGTFVRNGKRIGLLRIPSYMPVIPYLMSYGVRYYISELEKQSDYLIIDQTNNPGGAVVLSDLVVKSLVGSIDGKKHMKFRMKPTQGFLRTFAEIIHEIEAADATVEPGSENAARREYFLGEMKKNYALVEDAFRHGKSLSDPVALYVTSEYFEAMMDDLTKDLPLKGIIEKLIGGSIFSPQVYTKPVAFMINELDFSGGDATPAILQDYGRVKLIGVRTAGAGGTVEEFQSRVTSDLNFHLTTSLMYRKDGKYVENTGVHPDQAFELSAADYREGFKGTFDRLLSELGL